MAPRCAPTLQESGNGLPAPLGDTDENAMAIYHMVASELRLSMKDSERSPMQLFSPGAMSAKLSPCMRTNCARSSGTTAEASTSEASEVGAPGWTARNHAAASNNQAQKKLADEAALTCETTETTASSSCSASSVSLDDACSEEESPVLPNCGGMVSPSVFKAVPPKLRDDVSALRSPSVLGFIASMRDEVLSPESQPPSTARRMPMPWCNTSEISSDEISDEFVVENFSSDEDAHVPTCADHQGMICEWKETGTENPDKIFWVSRECEVICMSRNDTAESPSHSASRGGCQDEGVPLYPSDTALSKSHCLPCEEPHRSGFHQGCQDKALPLSPGDAALSKTHCSLRGGFDGKAVQLCAESSALSLAKKSFSDVQDELNELPCPCDTVLRTNHCSFGKSCNNLDEVLQQCSNGHACSPNEPLCAQDSNCKVNGQRPTDTVLSSNHCSVSESRHDIVGATQRCASGNAVSPNHPSCDTDCQDEELQPCSSGIAFSPNHPDPGEGSQESRDAAVAEEIEVSANDFTVHQQLFEQLITAEAKMREMEQVFARLQQLEKTKTRMRKQSARTETQFENDIRVSL